jgi:sugar (pentulose or hexulose) kinase
MGRTAAIWNRKVVPIEKGGPALGAAVAGAYAACESENLSFDVEQFSQKVLKRGKSIAPNPAEVAAYHNPSGYLEQFRTEEAKIISQHPIE